MPFQLHRQYKGPSIPKLSLLDAVTVGAVFFLWFAASFDPIGGFGLRYPALALALGLLVIKATLSQKSYHLSPQYRAMFFLFVVFIPLYGLIVGISRGGINGKFIDTSYISSAFYFICSLLYFDDRLDIEIFLQIAVLVLRLQCLLIFACFVTVLSSLPRDWIYYLTDHGLMFFGARQYGGITFPYLYVITTPMLILLIARDAWKFFEKPGTANPLLLLASAAALFLSGTRANMFAATVGILFLWLWYRYRGFAILHASAILVVAMLLFLAFKPGVIADMLSPSNSSNAVKISYLAGYDRLFSDPITMIFGQGYNAHVWSNEFSSMVNFGTASKTELTYLEFARVFGFVGVLTSLAVVYIAMKKFSSLSPHFQWVCPALLLYLAISAINPYIFSSNGMMVLGMCAAIGTIDTRKKKVSCKATSIDAMAQA